MNTRLASLALALTLAAPAAALAQGFDAPRVERTESRSFFGMPAWVDTARTGETVTTGSIDGRRGEAVTARTDRRAVRYGVSAE